MSETKPMTAHDACETPMSDHIERFWETIATEYVRVLIDIRRAHEPDSGVMYHWDSASFSDDVAKAICADRASLKAKAAAYDACRANLDCLSRGAVPVRDDGWRFDVENMPKVFGAKNIEIAYVSLENKPATAIVGWDGSRFVTARYIEKNIKMCPPETIYAWKMSTPPPAIPERSDLQPKDTAK